MAISKNTAKAAVPKAKEPVKATPAPVTKAAPVVEAEAVERIGRKELAATIREKVMAAGFGISPKVAEVAAVAYEEAVIEALQAGAQISLTGFGVFSVVHREAREATNPQKPGEKVHVEACDVPKFKAGSKLKAAVNGGADTSGATE